MKFNFVMFSTLFCLSAAACGHESPPAEVPTAATTTTSTPQSNAREAVGEHLTVSGDIYRLCKLQAQSDTQEAPKFAFDASLVTRSDAIVLDKIAVCLTAGPLSGRHVMLTGRADPRGTEEYNLSLGAKRASSVGSYLEAHKVGDTQLATTSRGALDASGDTESAWSIDRRVDIALQ